VLTDLGITVPVLAAPMAGGPTTPELVVAAGRAGSMGFVAGGYRTPQALAEQITRVRGAGVPFGVNLFVPDRRPVSIEDLDAYRTALTREAARYGVTLPDAPTTDDDHWADKIALLLDDPVPVVSFTFGLPDRATVDALRAKGTLVVQTVTSPHEARLAEESGAQALVVQSSAAGGHSATFTPSRTPPPLPLPRLVRDVAHAVELPLVAAGGIAGPADVTAALRAGGQAVAVGTVLLRTHESGASAPHRGALVDAAFDDTVVTRAFTGRPTRALRNEFTDRMGPLAPNAYPAVHHLTRPLRTAATEAGDTRAIHLWAGTGYRHARAEPVADTLDRLAGQE